MANDISLSAIAARTKQLVGSFLDLSLGMRLAIGGLLGALGSSTLLGFFAEYATVNYALANGIRVPTESVPFLGLTVTAVSLMFMLSAISSFFLIALTFRLI